MNAAMSAVAEPRKYEIEGVLKAAHSVLDKIRDLTGRAQDIQATYTGECPTVAQAATPVALGNVGGICGEIMTVLREIDGYSERMSGIFSKF
jgi:hypothetical protein